MRSLGRVPSTDTLVAPQTPFLKVTHPSLALSPPHTILDLKGREPMGTFDPETNVSPPDWLAP